MLILREHFSEMGASLNVRNNAIANEPVAAAGSSNDKPQWDIFWWMGRGHPVPRTFVLPRDKMRPMWNLWHWGNPNKNIGPYSRIKRFDLANKADASALTKLRVVMRIFRSIGFHLKLLSPTKQERCLGVDECDTLFEKSWEFLMIGRSLKPLKYLTVYKLYVLGKLNVSVDSNTDVLHDNDEFIVSRGDVEDEEGDVDMEHE
jgi:hypothetical protein